MSTGFSKAAIHLDNVNVDCSPANRDKIFNEDFGDADIYRDKILILPNPDGNEKWYYRVTAVFTKQNNRWYLQAKGINSRKVKDNYVVSTHKLNENYHISNACDRFDTDPHYIYRMIRVGKWKVKSNEQKKHLFQNLTDKIHTAKYSERGQNDIR
eukprot:Pgem_evm1s8436